MEQFVYIAFSFPTVVFTFLLGLSVLFWLVSLLGLFDSDSLFDGLDGDAGLDGLDGVDGADGIEGTDGVLAGLLWRFQLVGYPITLVFTVVSLLGWWICYYAMFFLNPLLPFDWLRYVAGVVLLPFALYGAAWLAGKFMKPLRRFYVHHEVSARGFIGKLAVVRTSRVDENFGEAVVNDGGAGLIVQVRSRTPLEFGARVVLLDFDANKHAYHVILEKDFLGAVRS